MQVKIIKIERVNSGIWYQWYIGAIITVIPGDGDLFDKDKTYEVIGPQELLDFHEKEYGYKRLGVEIEDVKDIRLEKLERILAKED